MADHEPTKQAGLEKLLLDLADKAAGKADAKGAAFPVYLILAGLVVIGFAVMGWLTLRSRRRAAQLAYELRVKQEEQKRAVEDARLHGSLEQRKAAGEAVVKLTSEVDGLKKKLEDAQKTAAQRSDAVAKASGWDDLIIVDKRKKKR